MRPSYHDVVAKILGRFADAPSPDLDEAVLVALQDMAEVAGLEHAYVVLRNGQAESFSMTYEWCAKGVLPQRESMQNVPFERYPWAAALLLGGAPLRIGRMEDFPANGEKERASSAAYGNRSMLLLPLHGRGGLINGALGLETVTYERSWGDDDVRQLGTIATVLANVLERKDSEQALRASQAQLHAITQLSPDIISIIDQSGTIVFNSPACKRIHGYDPEELIGKGAEGNWHPEDTPKVVQAFHHLLANPDSIVKAQYRYRNKDGSYVWMEASASNQLNDPVIQGIVTLSRDISDRKREEAERQELERKVQQIQKLESLGTLAGGVAHDFNNLLVAIMGNIDLALSDLPHHAPARQSLEAAWKASNRAADLARQMLAYAGRSRFEFEPLDMNDLVAEMSQVLEASLPKRVDLRMVRTPDLPLIEAEPSQIRQVVMNLILNASEAIGDQDGWIRVSLRTMDCDRQYLAGSWLGDELAETKYVVLDVSDSGCGMDAATKSKIFDPFFSTKFTGRGLGLAAVFGIVRGHKGAIRVTSEPGRGTNFRVLFPASTATARPSKAAAAAESRQHRGGCVMLVDDEQLVRDVAGRMLEHFGYSVVLAEDGAQAIEHLKRDCERPASDRFRLIVLDFSMPGLDGEQTFQQMRQIRADVPIIISSGYVESEVTKRFEGARFVDFMHKPFALDEFSEKVARAIRMVDKAHR